MKIVQFRRAVFFAFMLMLSVDGSAFANTVTEDGITWTFSVSDGEAILGGGSKSSPAIPTRTTGAISIPKTLGGYPVTRIGNYAFYGCSRLTSVTIRFVTNVGDNAFEGCSGLTSIRISSSVTRIGYSAFRDCSGVTSITIPNSVTSIGDYALDGCSGLTSITIPDSVTSIGGHAFSGCSGLVQPVYNASKTILWHVPGTITGTVSIPNSVTNIGNYAFYGCSKLTAVEIPDSVTNIGTQAFAHCSKLTAVEIPGSVTSIGEQTFAYCSKLTSVTIQDSVTSIGVSAFEHCSELISITIPGSVTSVGNFAFSCCYRLNSVVLSNGVTSIGQYAFSWCSNLTSVTIPNSVKSIGTLPFEYCSELNDVAVPGRFVLSSIFAYSYQTITNVSLAAGVTSIAASAFKNCSALTTITIPDSVTSIGARAFESCSALTAITIPGSVTSVGNYAFSGCSKLNSLMLSDGMTDIGEYAFSGCSKLTLVEMPDSVKSIGVSAFENCSGLISIAIPGSVTSVGNHAFSGCSKLNSVVFLDGVTSIGEHAFSGCKITSVTIPNSVTNLGYYAFDGRYVQAVTLPGRFLLSSAFEHCSLVTNVTISAGSTTIVSKMFKGCSGLKSIAIPDSVKSIEDGGTGNSSDCAFPDGNYPSLVEVRIADLSAWCSISFGSFPLNNPCFYSHKLFLNNEEIIHLVIPNGVTNVTSFAFYNCSGLKSVTIPDGVKSIGRQAFQGCTNLTEVHISDLAAWCYVSFETADANPCYYAHRLFLDNDEIQDLVVPLDVTRIGDCAFSGCSGLSSIAIPNEVVTIGAGAFYGCSELSSLMVPDSVSSIGKSAFSKCSGLETLYLPRRFNGSTDSLSIPATCSVYFFDANPVLSVYSEFGIPSPGVGQIECDETELVSASIFIPNPEPENRVRHVFLGWTGAGSVPAIGTGTNVAFTMLEDSTLAWNWRTDNAISVSVVETAECAFGTQWVEDGTTATATILPDTQFYTILLAGNTNGVVLNGTQLSIPSDGPRTIDVQVISAETAAIASDGKSPVWDMTRTDWRPVEEKTASDGLCLRSNDIGPGGFSTLAATVSGTGILSFLWKISAGRGDFCRFYVDGVEANSIQRSAGWQMVEIHLGSGTHALEWVYERGSGDATGTDASFVDNINWRPAVSIMVASMWGAASPETGNHSLVYGDEVTASVAEPESAGGTRHVCTGWTGTGSVPADGRGTNVSFRIEENSTLAWNWRTDHRIGLTVSGGTTDFTPQWVEAGTEVVAEIVPAAHLYAISLAGDIDGVSLAGTTLTIPADGPREIAVTVEEVKVSLAVESEWGAPSPTNGIHSLSWGTEIDAHIADPEPKGGVRYVCAGWTGTGSVPAGGGGTNVSFRIEEDSTLAWNWRTNVWIALATFGPVTADFTEGWTIIGETVVTEWAPSVPYFTVAFSGDTDGVTLDEVARTISIPADKPRNVSLSVTELTLAGALDAPGLVWTTDGTTPWFPQLGTSADGEDAAQSGIVPDGNSVSALQTMVTGEGMFSWTWRADVAGNAGVDLLLDGRWLDVYEPGPDWACETLAVEGAGTHEIRFEFWNAGTVVTREDCAYIDQVSWTPAKPASVVVEGVEIPVTWIAMNAPAALAAAGDDYEATAKAVAANGANKVWECYVAGLSPTNAAARFEARVGFENGEPVVTWDPDLGAARDYVVEGKTNLVDRSWGPTNESTRFYRVKVKLPE